MPRHGLFVERRLRHLVDTDEIESRVVAPVPWFPSRNGAFGSYAKFAAAPREEVRGGIRVSHPRYIVIPKIGMSITPTTMAMSALRELRKIRESGFDFDVIDAHYFYPDGVAAAYVGQKLGVPVLITARGTDLNLIPRYALPRKMIRWAADRALGMITVCAALKDVLVGMGVPEQRVTVLRNGVDLDFFRVTERGEARQELGLQPDRSYLLSVGLLIDRKGHDIPIRALASLPDAELLIAGDGERRRHLEELAVATGVQDRVTFLGSVAPERLRSYFSAANALVLASSREGWANVLLESMACGTPAIASNVWGTPEVVAEPVAGVLMPERTPAGLTEAYHSLMANYPTQRETRHYAERFSWDDTTQGQLDLMRRAANGTRAAA